MQSNRFTFLILILFIFLFTLTTAYAGIEFSWEDNGVALRQGYHLEWQRAGAIDEDGNTIFIWSDTRTGERGVYAQLYAPNGTMSWLEEGKVIIEAPVRQEDPDVIADGFGNFLVSWVDYRDNEYGDVWAQKIDINGNQLWDPLGVPLCTIDSVHSLYLHTMPDGEGGAMVVWGDDRSGDDGDIYAHHVLSTGVVDPTWPVNGLMIAGGSGGQGAEGGKTVDTDGNGGIWVGWSDTRDSGNPDIYLQHVDTEGNLMASAYDGIPIAIVSDYQEAVKLAPDGNGGVFMVWRDKRNYGSSLEDLYMQHVNSLGNPTFTTNGVPLVSRPYTQEGARIVYDGMGGAIIIWEDYRSGALTNDIYAQRIDMQGNLLWGAEDVLVCGAQANQLYVRLYSDSNGGAVAAWTDDRFGGYPLGDIYAQKLFANGTVAWETDGIAVNDDPYRQENPLVRVHTDGTSFIAWADFRFGSVGIYTQIYNPGGVALLEDNGSQIVWGVDGNAQNVQIMKLSDSPEKFMVVWDDYRNGDDPGALLYQQVFDLNANFDFIFNGKPVCIKYENFIQNMAGGQTVPKLVSDDQNGAIVCWIDSRIANGNDQIYTQRLDNNGDFMWDSLGVRIYPTTSSQKHNYICEDGSGGAYIAFSGYEPNWYLKAKVVHIDGIGNILGSINLSPEDSVDEKVLDIVSDNNSGAYVFWNGSEDIYGARIVAPCDTAWTVVICDMPEYQDNIKAVVNDNDEAVLVWEDKRPVDNLDIYAQKLTLDGTESWGDNGTPVIQFDLDQSFSSIALDYDDNLYVVWQDMRSVFENDIYMQKLDGNTGTKLFQENGIPVVVNGDGDQSAPLVVASNDNGLYIVWEDIRYINQDIYSSAFDYQGQLASGWVENGDVICDFSNVQDAPLLIDDGRGGVISVWIDYRSSGKVQLFNLYMQRWLEPSWFLSVVNNNVIGPVNFELSQNYPNPFNPATNIRFNLPESGKVKLTIFNTLGQEVNVLVDKRLDAGTHSVVWDGSSFSGDFAATGIYYYKLEVNDNTKIMKMLMLK